MRERVFMKDAAQGMAKGYEMLIYEKSFLSISKSIEKVPGEIDES